MNNEQEQDTTTITILAKDTKDIFRQIRVMTKPQDYKFKDVKLKQDNEYQPITTTIIFEHVNNVEIPKRNEQTTTES